MPVIGATNFEQTHTEQISAQLEIMGHLEIHMNETICSPSPLPIYDQMVSTSTRRHTPKLQFVVNQSCEGRKVAVPLSCSYGSLWIDQMKGVKGTMWGSAKVACAICTETGH
jgi:hypothetical protein